MRSVLLVCLLLTVPSYALAAPSLAVVGDPVDFGNGKVGFTVAINWNDALTASGYFALSASGTSGSTIQQQNALANIVINTVGDADLFGSLDPSYIKAQDSWWYAGGTQPFANQAPPYNGVLPNSGNIGSNLYQASFGTATTTPVFGSSNIVNLVLNKVGNEANGQVSGTVSRAGIDYNLSIPLHYVGFTSLGVSPSPLAFGYVRLGTTASMGLTVTNTGTGSSLNGSFSGASGEFGPASAQNFGPLGATQSATRSYTYAPTVRGADDTTVTVTSDASSGSNSAVVPLSGIGVGPDFDAVPPANSSFVFDISLTSSSSHPLSVSNASTDENGGNAALTNLTFVDVGLSGAAAADFSVNNLNDGDVLGKGQSRVATIGFGASRNYRPHTATLTLATDEGAPVGGNGADYSYQLVAAPRTAGIWQSLAGGAWENAANWSLNTVPTASEITRFSLEGAYTVSLGTNRNQAGLIVTNDDVRIDLNAHTLGLSGNLLVGDLATSLGRLTIEDGSVSAAGLQVATAATASGRIEIAAGGVLQTANAYLGGTHLAAGGSGAAVVHAGGSLATTGAIKVWPTGSLELDQGHVAANAGIELAGGALLGTGTVTATVFNSGIVDPTGVLDVAGVYVQSPSGQLTIDAGPAAYDALHVSNIAVLAGGLEVVFADGYAPTYGDTFEVLTFGSRSGQFQSITGTEFAPGRFMFPVYSATALTLYAITGGDGNGDGFVTPADYTIWADHFGQGPGATILQGDYNLDGFVNGADYTVWADSYTGVPPAGPIAIPEPGSGALALAACLVIAGTRIHRRADRDWPRKRT